MIDKEITIEGSLTEEQIEWRTVIAFGFGLVALLAWVLASTGALFWALPLLDQYKLLFWGAWCFWMYANLRWRITIARWNDSITKWRDTIAMLDAVNHANKDLIERVRELEAELEELV